jgi:hypothetical protein
MKKLALLILAVLSVISCDKKDDETPTKLKLLTNGSSKNWNITDESPEDSDEGCRPSAPFIMDNTWTFKSNGEFFFDHGTITEGSTCSDFKNLTGNWSFQENESKLLITLRVNTDDPDDTFDNDTLALATIETLTSSSMVLENSNYQATFTPK